ncbi:MAG: hypothetical protein K0S74_1427 [Chlamydiales bacterium]|jgi:hypothetical protein|nr:hypothetical protein [Chlamydiales bacterium]
MNFTALHPDLIKRTISFIEDGKDYVHVRQSCKQLYGIANAYQSDWCQQNIKQIFHTAISNFTCDLGKKEIVSIKHKICCLHQVGKAFNFLNTLKLQGIFDKIIKRVFELEGYILPEGNHDQTLTKEQLKAIGYEIQYLAAIFNTLIEDCFSKDKVFSQEIVEASNAQKDLANEIEQAKESIKKSIGKFMSSSNSFPKLAFWSGRLLFLKEAYTLQSFGKFKDFMNSDEMLKVYSELETKLQAYDKSKIKLQEKIQREKAITQGTGADASLRQQHLSQIQQDEDILKLLNMNIKIITDYLRFFRL